MKQLIMVVEDDEMIRNLIKLYLEKDNFEVIEAADGVEAKQLFLTYKPCLIILDLMLPRLSGEQFCIWLRDDLTNREVPIIMLSAKSQLSDKIGGLKIGADNYLTKPFHPEELVAHVKAMIRRTNKCDQQISSGGLTIISTKREFFSDGKLIYLTKHEFDLLYFLMSHPNVVFTREQLVNELYKFEEKSVLDRTIDAHIKKLREKVEEVPSNPQRIKTVRGMGYKFVHE